MNHKKEKKLRKEFGFYRGVYGKGLPFECGDGWYDLIYNLSKEVQKLIDDGKLDEDFNVHQVKEKFGSLRYYTSYITDELEELIDAAEELSEVICENCGEEGETRDINGWYSTLCDSCYSDRIMAIEALVTQVDSKGAENEENTP